jgi:hypothetical protein
MRPTLEDERDLEPWDDDPDGVDAHYIRESSEPEIDDSAESLLRVHDHPATAQQRRLFCQPPGCRIPC